MASSAGLAELPGNFDQSLMQSAQHLLRAGGVSDVRVLQAGAVVTGVVAAPMQSGAAQSRGHRVYVRRRSADFDCECTCDEAVPCVHVVAVLIAAASGAPSRQGGAADESPLRQRATGESPSPRAVIDAPVDSSASRQEIYYLIDFAGPDAASGFRVGAWVAQAASDSASPLAARIMASIARREAVPRYVNDEDREILPALVARHAEGPWVLSDASGAVLLRQIVATGRAYWQALWGEPMTSGDLLSDARQAAVEPTSRSTPGARLSLSEDLKVTLQFVYGERGIDSRVLRFSSLCTGVGAFRDLEGEAQLQGTLDRLMPTLPPDPETWLSFVLDSVPLLRAQGWEVQIDSAFPYRVVETEGWYADLQANEANENTPRPRSTRPHHGPREWFDLRLGVRVAGLEVNLLPAVMSYLQSKLDGDAASRDPSDFLRIEGRLLFRLDDGRYFPVAIERIERIAGALVELFDRDVLNERRALPLQVAQASRVAQLAQELSSFETRGDESPEWSLRSNDRGIRALIEELASFTGIEPLRASESFPVALRPYQQEGLGWLQFLRRFGLGGILADDMGLGKTVQTLAHLVLEKEQGRLRKPALIVAPVSVIGNWQKELARFAPQLSTLILHGSRRRESFGMMDGADVVVTGYPQLQLDGEALLARKFSFVILDEAQMIRNPRAKVSQAARSLQADHHLCLTGTPMENHLGELWSLFEFVQPGLLGNEQAFTRQFRTPIEKGGDSARARSLTRRIAPFLLRRTKDAVARDLPEKTQIVESLVMDERQRDLYDSVRLAMHGRVREVIQQQGLARSRITVLDALLRLRQACCDPRLLPIDAREGEEPVPGAKMEWLTTVLPELVAEGRRILLFSQFTSMLSLIEEAVRQLSIPSLTLTGATRERGRVVERFQAGEAPVFLISLKAGGAGLNLTAADTVIHYDPWWNPAAEAQATDRAHRIGQDKPVFIHKLICQDTVEEKILQLQDDKQSLASQLYAGQNAAPGQWSAADLEALFAP